MSFLLLSLLFISSCKNQSDLKLPEKLLNHYPIAFNQGMHESIKGIVLKSDFRASVTGDTLLFYAEIGNQTSEAIRISSYGFELKTKEGHRSHSVNQDPESFIPAHKSKIFCLKFTPINSRFLYSRTGYRGDLDSSYTLTIDCFKGNSKAKFPSLTINYNGIKVGCGIDLSAFRKNDKFAFFEVDKSHKFSGSGINDKLKVNRKGQGVVSNKYAVQSGTVHLSETEILIDGTTYSTKFYTLEEHLYLMLKIINHGRKAIYFHPNLLTLRDNDETYVPESKNKERGDQLILDDGEYVLKKGQRYETLMSYGSFKSESFTLNLSSMLDTLNNNMDSNMMIAFKRTKHQ
ncbi:hypothetical protein EO244_07465 [Ancylomarina salipaludis]|uniref:Uncharacterized protein n=1 Tax=Ancylomarina salipaludis TaxID=2501299 RepID=A0A4V1N086_9BACT|nr:hypothetical protein [Ancylomarina salipaludis]RXQ95692.1 hypothetical protein EO244_07465 [Ancylomarina salipaludis]